MISCETTDFLNRLESVNWDFTGPNNREHIHDIHPYPAKFIPQIPRELIRLFHPRDHSAVLDPFCGSGTTLVEAVKLGLPTIGIDLHPLAALIAKTKTTPLKSSILPVAQALVAKARGEHTNIPPIPNLDHWFMSDIQQALANLTYRIDQIEDMICRDCLKVALSRIINRVSNQESDTRYAAIKKSVSSNDVYSLFLTSVSFIESALLETYSGVFCSEPKCSVINQNILEVKPESIGKNIGLVVTSPPYPNAYEYWLYHKYRMYWLGMDPQLVRKAEIGARPNYFRKNPETESDFEEQMTQVFKLLASVMINKSIACFIVGRSVIHKREIDNGMILERAGALCGFQMVAKVTRKIPSAQKSFNPVLSTINQEAIIIFQLGSIG